ncbi:ATP phosphoribosyltransferase [Candidatus Mycalebacterium sp.]
MIKIAISRGRLFEESLEVLNKAGIKIKSAAKKSRKLIHVVKEHDLTIFVVRPTDVPSYVEHGVADCGIVGKDSLMEQENNLYEPLDMGIGKCKMVVAAPKGYKFPNGGIVRIATKYPRIAADWFEKKNVRTEIIKLYGSVELACMVGLSDVIVDLTASGKTMEENNLEEIEFIAPITARLVVNKAGMKLKSPQIYEFISKIEKWCVREA